MTGSVPYKIAHTQRIDDDGAYTVMVIDAPCPG